MGEHGCCLSKICLAGGYVEGAYMPTRARLACSHRKRTRLPRSEKGNGSMPVFTLSDSAPKEKPASDTLDLTDDGDFELDIRITPTSGKMSSSVADLPTTTANTAGDCTNTCICSVTCTCNGD